MKTLVASVPIAVVAVSACWLAVAPAAIGQTLHPAERAGIKSIIGEPTQITFVNESAQAIRIYWINYEGKRVLYQQLSPGEQYGVDTFLQISRLGNKNEQLATRASMDAI